MMSEFHGLTMMSIFHGLTMMRKDMDYHDEGALHGLTMMSSLPWSYHDENGLENRMRASMD